VRKKTSRQKRWQEITVSRMSEPCSLKLESCGGKKKRLTLGVADLDGKIAEGRSQLGRKAKGARRGNKVLEVLERRGLIRGGTKAKRGD